MTVQLASFLDSLPVAAALGRLVKNRLELTAFNHAYAEWERKSGAAMQPSSSFVTHLALEAMDSSKGKVSKRWTSPDAVVRNDIDVTAAVIDGPEADGRDIIVTYVDRTAEIVTRQSLHREMVSDSLTGLSNRAGFEEKIDASIEAKSEMANLPGSPAKYTVIVVDLVRFSQVNECAGGVVGDELIITFARRLVGRMRKPDIVARIGGNEFAIFAHLGANPETEVDRIVARIRSVLDDPFRLSDLEIQADAAIGVAFGKLGKSNPTDCIRHAQIALKRSKQSAQVEIYTPEALDRARRRFSVETSLRKALENRKLELAYQPLIDLSNGYVIGFEALARWNDPERGAISPAEFIPVAEDSGLIVPLGRWALEESCATLKLWDQRAGEALPIKMNVNVSAIQFAREDLPKMVASTLRATHLPPERITLELTESVVVSDPERAVSVMQALRDLKVHLAMDDFGTGYSNLAFLQRLPIDVLKIDQSFVTRMLEDRDKIAIIRAILSLATALGMETTAEGIESLELCNTLAALGCSFGQGYYFSAPVPEQKAYEFFMRRRDNPGLANINS